MKKHFAELAFAKRNLRKRNEKRLGSVLVLATGVIIMVFGFLAFTVDIGYISLTKAQLEAASDAGARAAVNELKDGLGTGKTLTQEEAQSVATQAAVDVAAANRAGDQQQVFANGSRDVRFGNVTYDTASGSWNKQWGVTPYNMVELTLHRDQAPPQGEGGSGTSSANAGAPDGPLPLFFAPVIGHEEATLSTKAVAALLPGNGFRVAQGSGMTVDILPFAVDNPTWESLLAKDSSLQDNYSYNPETGAVTNGPDGILEIDMYPYGNGALPPGNRGTVDLGSSNNSSADIARQILYGMNADDFSYFPESTIVCKPETPIELNGDTGISAGFKDELEAIKGQPRAIPIFIDVSGNGNNAMYTVIKFVGIRIMHVKLTGNPKRVVVQPCTFSCKTVVYDTTGGPIAEDTIFSTPVLIQ